MSELFIARPDVFSAPAQKFLTIGADFGKEIVRIGYDGSVTVNPEFTVDQAAKAFWDAVIKMNPHIAPKP